MREETNDDIQKRLLQEDACAKAFDRLPLERWPRALIFFDYGEENEPGMAVSFKTSMPLPRLAALVEKLIDSWRTGEIRHATANATPPPDVFLRADQIARSEASKLGWGHALLAGDAPLYAASGAREDMIRLFQNELLPHWRAMGERLNPGLSRCSGVSSA